MSILDALLKKSETSSEFLKFQLRNSCCIILQASLAMLVAH
jgi:hypothetical protein